jgi:hypothetical protein
MHGRHVWSVCNLTRWSIVCHWKARKYPRGELRKHHRGTSRLSRVSDCDPDQFLKLSLLYARVNIIVLTIAANYLQTNTVTFVCMINIGNLG